MYTKIILVVDEGVLGAINKINDLQESRNGFLSLISADFQPIPEQEAHATQINITSDIMSIGISNKIINCLMLPRRTQNGVLKVDPDMRISTIYDLCSKSEDDLKKYAGIGIKAVEEIKSKLAHHGLSLAN